MTFFSSISHTHTHTFILQHPSSHTSKNFFKKILFSVEREEREREREREMIPMLGGAGVCGALGYLLQKSADGKAEEAVEMRQRTRRRRIVCTRI